MAYQEKPGGGALFTNDKRTSDKSPSMTGYITAHRDIKKGERLRLAAWTKGGDGGKAKFLSVTMSDERERQSDAGQHAPQQDDPF